MIGENIAYVENHSIQVDITKLIDNFYRILEPILIDSDEKEEMLTIYTKSHLDSANVASNIVYLRVRQTEEKKRT